jgi:hypothetical protein
MTKLIAVGIIAVVLYGGWELFLYWDKVKNEERVARKEAAATQVVGDQLSGVPYTMEPSLRAAQEKGAAALKNWLQTYDAVIQDPRKAWLWLDYCVEVAKEDPAEARRVFASVKQHLPASSPVWPRVKTLERTYE